MNDKPVNEQDVVEILSDCLWGTLVGSRGVVQQSFQYKQALVKFQSPRRWQNPYDLQEIIQCTDWLIDWKYIKVIDSAFGNSVAVLESQLEMLEDDLTTVRCCLSMSEEMRELQESQIEKMIIEIDQLKAEIYLLKGGCNEN